MDMLQEIRKMIREGMAEYKALSFMAERILRKVADLNYGSVTMFAKGLLDGPMMLNHPIRLSSITEILSDPDLSGTDLAAIVSQYKAFNIEFLFTPVASKEKGDYTSYKTEDGRTYEVRIRMFFNKELLESVKRIGIKEWDPNRVFNLIWQTFSSNLVHELKHAVDDHRFQDIQKNGRPVFQGTSPINSPAFRFKQRKKAGAPDPETQKDEWLAYHTEYLRMPHEVWARFSQLVHAIDFKRETDDLYAHMPDGSKGITYVMEPLRNVLGKISTMYGWEKIEESQRRRLIRALSNLWHEENTWVERNNREVARYR